MNSHEFCQSYIQISSSDGFVQQLRAYIMGRIQFTNIIIDDFSIAKKEPRTTFTHILTHIHTDHLKGLYDGWNYGPIYCSKITSQLLKQRYPSLNCTQVLELETPTILKMSENLEITLTLFNANHCMGSVMALLQGYMGNILYTGDIRFNRTIFQKYYRLYPMSKQNDQFDNCSIPIDVLYLDNTFLKPNFAFPTQEDALKQTIEFIDYLITLGKHTRIYIGLDTYGKQQVFQQIAKHLDTYIVVDERRYERLKATEFDLQLLTTNTEEGWIQIVQKSKLKQHLLNQPQAIGIILSGWVNQANYKFNDRIYCIPYSLHSNYNQIYSFVASIRPSYIYPIVANYPGTQKIFYADKTCSKKRNIQLNQLSLDRSNLKKGIPQLIVAQQQPNYSEDIKLLRETLCSPPSATYKQLMNDFQFQKIVLKKLEPPKSFDISLDEYSMKSVNLPTAERKKYKLQAQRNQNQINRIKNQLQMRKKIIEGEQIQILDDNDNSQDYNDKKDQILSKEEDKLKIKNNILKKYDKLYMQKKYQSAQIVNIDEVDDEVIEIDPFQNNTKAKKVFIDNNRNYKQISSIKSVAIVTQREGKPTQTAFSKQFEAKFLDRIKDKLKQSQKNANISKEDKSIQKDVINIDKQSKNIQKPAIKIQRSSSPIFYNKNKRLSICNLNLNNIQKIKQVSSSNKIKNLLEGSMIIKSFIKSFINLNKQSKNRKPV